MSDYDLVGWLRALSPAEAKVVVLHAVLGLTQVEITEVIGKSRARVWQHWTKAVAQLPAHRTAA